jgi:hypothetical protein
MDLPSHGVLTRLVARSLGMSTQDLLLALAPASLAEFDSVLAFRQQHLHVQAQWDDSAYLRWRYRFGRVDAGIGDLWRLRRGDEIMAIFGLEELTCELDERTHRGARGMDLLVRTDLRETGIGAWLNQAMIERHEFALAMGSNKDSAGIVLRMFKPLSPRLTFTLPLDTHPFIRRRWPDVPLLAATTAGAANIGLALWRAWLRRRHPRQLRFVSVRRVTQDAIASVRPAPAAVRITRSAEYLNRRLLDNPRRQYEVRVAYRGSAPAGYVAWARVDDDNGQAELHLADWHYDSAATLIELLLEAIDAAVSTGCSCARMVLQDDASRAAAKAIGFAPAHDDPGRITGVQACDADLAQRLVEAKWALTDATDDTDGY